MKSWKLHTAANPGLCFVDGKDPRRASSLEVSHLHTSQIYASTISQGWRLGQLRWPDRHKTYETWINDEAIERCGKRNQKQVWGRFMPWHHHHAINEKAVVWVTGEVLTYWLGTMTWRQGMKEDPGMYFGDEEMIIPQIQRYLALTSLYWGDNAINPIISYGTS